jgi:hypothetical protein
MRNQSRGWRLSDRPGISGLVLALPLTVGNMAVVLGRRGPRPKQARPAGPNHSAGRAPRASREGVCPVPPTHVGKS